MEQIKTLKSKKFAGFTLIEILVAIAVLGIAVASATRIFFANISAKRKTNSLALIRQSGDYTLLTIAAIIKNSKGIVEDTYPCLPSMPKLEVLNPDGSTSVFSCTGDTDGDCVSNIGSEVIAVDGNCLTGADFSLNTCSFSCDQSAIVGKPMVITVNFALTKGTPVSILDYATQSFNTTVSLRNY